MTTEQMTQQIAEYFKTQSVFLHMLVCGVNCRNVCVVRLTWLKKVLCVLPLKILQNETGGWYMRESLKDIDRLQHIEELK